MPRVRQVQQQALEEYRERSRVSSKRKKNKARKQIGEFVITFACLFFLLSLVFLQIAKKVTPNVDTSVGNNSIEVAEQNDDNDKRAIDDRLKLIQFNDSMISGELQRQKENDIFNKDLESPVIIPARKTSAQIDDTIPPDEVLKHDVRNVITQAENKEKTLAPVPQKVSANNSLISSETSGSQKQEDLDKKIAAIQSSPLTINAPANYKVLVGSYQTSEQAQLAKSILKDTVQGRNAFVKFVNGFYTLQVGSYTTMEQANAVAKDLSANSFPAKVYYEKNVSAPVKPIN